MNKEELENKLRYKIPEIRLVLLKESGKESGTIYKATDIEKYIEPLKYYSEEHFVSFHLDVNLSVIGYHIAAHGTLSESLVHPRELFKAAMLNNAHSIIVVHNHPGGSLTPSREDLITTRMLVKASAILGIALIDHIIVNSESIRSLRETDDYLWPK